MKFRPGQRKTPSEPNSLIYFSKRRSVLDVVIFVSWPECYLAQPRLRQQTNCVRPAAGCAPLSADSPAQPARGLGPLRQHGSSGQGAQQVLAHRIRVLVVVQSLRGLRAVRLESDQHTSVRALLSLSNHTPTEVTTRTAPPAPWTGLSSTNA